MNDDIITVNMLAKAIINSNRDIDEKEAIHMAEHILGFFGYDDRMIDNYFSNDDRNVLYYLEEKGIVISEMQEIPLYNGNKWRVFYWILNRQKIKELQETKEENVYDNDDIWNGKF